MKGRVTKERTIPVRNVQQAYRTTIQKRDAKHSMCHRAIDILENHKVDAFHIPSTTSYRGPKHPPTPPPYPFQAPPAAILLYESKC